jgi:hypothetical protein
MKVKLGLDRLTHDELADKGDVVKAAMTTNAATFPAPPLTMAATGTLIATLRSAITARNSGETTLKNLVQAENDAAVALTGGLTQHASYVDSRAAGNAGIITLSGMGVRQAAAAVGPMPKVLNLKTTTSDFTGSLDWMCQPVAGVKAYVLQKCVGDPAVEANWSHADVAGKSNGTLRGLAVGNVWIRVAAKGADENLGPWSDPAQEVVR